MTYQPADTRLVMYQGADFTATFTVPATGTPTNLTTYTARMKAAKVVHGRIVETVLSLTNGAGITLGSSTSNVAIAVAGADTAAIDGGTYRYDIEIVSGSGAVSRIAQGRLTVYGEVTT